MPISFPIICAPSRTIFAISARDTDTTSFFQKLHKRDFHLSVTRPESGHHCPADEQTRQKIGFATLNQRISGGPNPRFPIIKTTTRDLG
jgi:hypothetical protein